METQDQDSTEEDGGWYSLPLEERRASLPSRIAKLTLRLEVPRQLIDRDDIVNAVQEYEGHVQPLVRVITAALVLCWPDAQRREGMPRYKGDVLEFGGKAYTFLLGQGATQAEILRAGNVASGLCMQAALAQQAAQEEARGNSRAPNGGGGSSNSSQSRSGSALASAALASSTPDSQDS